ncbi:MAG: TAXI family TRAP transporter solute-binding subunit [Candidatus Parabeggiatoa sp.]|nr:TAXI family TRAP transporter solute-binding subunit [Candidatus Parabeggiatoa sp.]
MNKNENGAKKRSWLKTLISLIVLTIIGAIINDLYDNILRKEAKSFYDEIVVKCSSICFDTEPVRCTESENEIDVQIGTDINNLLALNNIGPTAFPANGSLDNINAIHDRPDIQLGIAQSDALSYMRDYLGEAQKMKQIKMVFPLYNKEVHILAKKEISSFYDLTGKSVAIGQEKSDSYLTATQLFKLAKIEPKYVKKGGTEAINELLNGQIDAIFHVAGYPVKCFKDIAQNSDLHLLPITPKKEFTYLYPSTTIPASTYGDWQKEYVQTIAVKAVLITYDYNERNDICNNVGKLANKIYNNLDWLKQNGHEKWKTVNFHDFKFNNLRNWERSVCVEKQIE